MHSAVREDVDTVATEIFMHNTRNAKELNFSFTLLPHDLPIESACGFNLKCWLCSVLFDLCVVHHGTHMEHILLVSGTEDGEMFHLQHTHSAYMISTDLKGVCVCFFFHSVANIV